jgi:hypothetical protein
MPRAVRLLLFMLLGDCKQAEPIKRIFSSALRKALAAKLALSRSTPIKRNLRKSKQTIRKMPTTYGHRRLS